MSQKELSVDECKNVLAELQQDTHDLVELGISVPRYFFRGEREDYGLSTPSVFRYPNLHQKYVEDVRKIYDKGLRKRSNTGALLRFMHENLAQAFVLILTDYQLPDGKPLVPPVAAVTCRTLLGSLPEDSKLPFLYSIEALLQHYGFQTRCLDITTDIDAALFFSLYGEPLPTLPRRGYVHYYDIKEMRSDLYIAQSGQVEIYDLRDICRFLELRFGHDTRPNKQCGVIVRGKLTSDFEYLENFKKTLVVGFEQKDESYRDELWQRAYLARDGLHDDLMSIFRHFLEHRIENFRKTGGNRDAVYHLFLESALEEMDRGAHDIRRINDAFLSRLRDLPASEFRSDRH